MSEHTPGPWTVDVSDGWIRTVDPVEGLAVCRMRPTCVTSTWEANARLIAAAPDLLDAAKLTTLHFKRNQVSGNFQGDDEHEAWVALNKAITKAEGRS